MQDSDISDLFTEVLANLKVSNREEIGQRRDALTKALNEEFRSVGDETNHRLMVGSFGRHTSINGCSDLDMVYILPQSLKTSYSSEEGPRRVLERTRKAMMKHYPSTTMEVRRLVVCVKFADFMFEVQPVFEDEDGSFLFPDTYKKTWRTTNPRAEIDEFKDFNEATAGSLRKLCRLTRAWKDKHAVKMGGLLIDTLAYDFLQDHDEYWAKCNLAIMLRDFFAWVAGQENREFYYAPGSNQKVFVKHGFRKKASAALKLADEALAAQDESQLAERWRLVLAKVVPISDAEQDADLDYIDTEEFIEDFFTEELSYSLEVGCKVTYGGIQLSLDQWLKKYGKLQHDCNLRFNIQSHNVPEPFEVRWKVLNRGAEARRLNMIRGTIIEGSAVHAHVETTMFRGNHYVECYLICNGLLVARSRIDVPIA
ncbi:MAG: nucleotidyltransferase [Bifidobacteriaceae bacterium]|nr:nucleotidyltransferase [Bifidobacteriaceae bacterium]